MRGGWTFAESIPLDGPQQPRDLTKKMMETEIHQYDNAGGTRRRK